MPKNLTTSKFNYIQQGTSDVDSTDENIVANYRKDTDFEKILHDNIWSGNINVDFYTTKRRCVDKEEEKPIPQLVCDTLWIAMAAVHAFAHAIDCQMNYHPQLIEGINRSSDEGVERLWAYLCCYIAMIKEMGLENRHFMLYMTDVFKNELIRFDLRRRNVRNSWKNSLESMLRTILMASGVKWENKKVVVESTGRSCIRSQIPVLDKDVYELERSLRLPDQQPLPWSLFILPSKSIRFISRTKKSCSEIY
ncbi:hypothetical protein K501DRAFT_277162 [Backusella circina FSU 941]|nr:hypothetical protein K501DRAFT_277162 [Backusella circina FSU 941]